MTKPQPLKSTCHIGKATDPSSRLLIAVNWCFTHQRLANGTECLSAKVLRDAIQETEARITSELEKINMVPKLNGICGIGCCIFHNHWLPKMPPIMWKGRSPILSFTLSMPFGMARISSTVKPMLSGCEGTPSAHSQGK